jgi:ABC-type nickel/cobalt efflux system permease component RcnA
VVCRRHPRAAGGGEAGALAVFWTVRFGHGVLHAAGPGHGKPVIGGHGMARRVPVARLAGLALASSLAQAAVAVALVYALVAAPGLARGSVEGAAEDRLTPAGHAMIEGPGLWLIWRGVAGLRSAAAKHDHGARGTGAHHHDGHSHDPRDHRHQGHGSHDHRPHDHGPECGHAHGPTLEEGARVTGWRDGLALVAGIAVRPCSGALFVLVLTWQLGFALAGIIGTFVMGLGTALLTAGVARMADWARTRAGRFATGPGCPGASGPGPGLGQRDRRSGAGASCPVALTRGRPPHLVPPDPPA